MQECDLLNNKKLPVDVICGLDELSSYIGLCASFIKKNKDIQKKITKKEIEDINEILKYILTTLLSINSKLGSNTNKIQITDKNTKKLEEFIDNLDSALSPITFFILPTGAIEAAHLQIARAITRRIEREMIKATIENEEINKFMNRLSDLLFVLARYTNKVLNIEDIAWKH